VTSPGPDAQSTAGSASPRAFEHEHSRPRTAPSEPFDAGGHGGLATQGSIATRSSERRYLAIALLLIALFMVAEIVTAVASGSLALFADAGHMLTDAGAIAMAIWASRLAEHRASDTWTFGLKRAEIVSAAVNGVALVVIAGLIAFEAIVRLLHPDKVTGAVLVGVAIAGVGVNLAATLVLAKANRASLNIAGAFAHLLTDLWAFLGTAVAGIVILVTGFERADAIAALGVTSLMLLAGWRLLRDSGRVLLEGAPAHMDLTEVRAHLLQLPQVTEIHDLHAWVVTSDLPALSAHITVSSHCFVDGQAPEILDQLQACLLGHFDVAHSTFQLEPPGHTNHETSAH